MNALTNVGIVIDDPELNMLLNNKESGFNYRQRRQEDWFENYTLYRDRVIINRLTQRQSVNLPLMKTTLRTLIKDVDDMPVLYFENLDNNKEAETFQNEYWKWVVDDNKMDLLDIIDKRQVFLFGRTFDQMQIVDGKIKFTIQDPEDILVDRYMDPSNIDSARFLIHTHIFKPLSTLANNPDYDQTAVKKLQEFYATKLGLIRAADNAQLMADKNKKLQEMGVPDIESPVLGETYVELSLHFCYHKEPEDSEEQLYLYTEADDMVILNKKPHEKIVGTTKDHYWRNHLLYGTWADDLERQDFWSDGIADIVRTPNKVLNSWFSQLVENRTLRNFGMHYYDSTLEGFNPQTFEPVAWGWYGIPGKPADVIQKVDIPDLSESLDEMSFIITMVEKATGATATQEGAQTDRQITLGEVQLALGEAKQRIKGMSKFYTPAWKQRGEKFLKLIEAASDKLDAVKIYKKGRNTGNLYTREISPEDWMTKSGYTTRVWSQDEKKAQDTQSLEKLNAVKMNMPGNPKLDEIYDRKLLEFADLSPSEINDIMEFQNQKREALAGTQGMAPYMQPQLGAGQPGQPGQGPKPQPQMQSRPNPPPAPPPMMG